MAEADWQVFMNHHKESRTCGVCGDFACRPFGEVARWNFSRVREYTTTSLSIDDLNRVYCEMSSHKRRSSKDVAAAICILSPRGLKMVFGNVRVAKSNA